MKGGWYTEMLKSENIKKLLGALLVGSVILIGCSKDDSSIEDEIKSDGDSTQTEEEIDSDFDVEFDDDDDFFDDVDSDDVDDFSEEDVDDE